ncbi:cathepsin B-like cysteine proteinase 4 [Nilaparvata lugens]|uniref:cathepsin B-like cysteine proteinase 4 n=1 Tax=Nilaparvata lugens TaxID=108931 RepID=UPI00193E8A2C|nr:cathepsin B-like cysteine proteinase 4 [Nilaparvata lugens]
MRLFKASDIFQLIAVFCLICSSQSFVVEDENENSNHLIRKINAFGSTWRAESNNLDGLSLHFYEGLLGANLDEDFGKIELKTLDHFKNNREIPENFDAREHWRNCNSIGHVRDQANCGSCWAVAAAEALTDRFCIASKGKIKTHLSMEDLLSCCNECGYGCNGGYLGKAWNYLKVNGIVSGGDFDSHEGCKPYSIMPCDSFGNSTLKTCRYLGIEDTPSCSTRCTNSKHSKSFANDHHKVKNYYRLKDVTAIQREIMESGPVEASFKVYADFQFYKSGVYRHLFGKLRGGHAIKIIGWGVERGTPYWLIVNSWTTHWGENGLFRILRGTNECDIEKGVIAGQAKVEDHL